MFDPMLWQRTKVTVIVLLVIGGFLLLPAAYVFLLAGVLLSSGAIDMAWEEGVAHLFWSAILGSGFGCLSWITLWLLLFQRNSIRVHLVTWHLLRVAGVILFVCTGIWLVSFLIDSPFPTNPGDIDMLTLVLIAICAVALLIVWFGHRYLGLARRAAKQQAEPLPS